MGKPRRLAAIAKMQEPDRAIAKRLHTLIKAAAPGLAAKTWYGMPAYTKDGDVICYFQNAGKFKVRYQTLGFSDKAQDRRRRHVADSVRAQQVDCHRRGKDHGAGEEGGALKFAERRPPIGID
jgi:hypothetical protein